MEPISEQSLRAMTLGDLANAYREWWDVHDEWEDHIKAVTSQLKAIEGAIKARMAEDNIEEYKGERLSVSIKEDVAPKVEDWQKVFAWIFETGRHELLRKQLNTAPFRELIEDCVALPDGLGINPYTKFNRRRK